MKKYSFVIDSTGQTRDLHSLQFKVVHDPLKKLRDSVTNFMLNNSVKVMIFDYPDCMVTFRYRKCNNRFPFAVVVEPYNKTL